LIKNLSKQQQSDNSSSNSRRRRRTTKAKVWCGNICRVQRTSKDYGPRGSRIFESACEFISSHEYVPKAIFLSVLYEAEILLKQYLSAMFGFKETDFAILYESALNVVTTRNQLDNNIKEGRSK
jgi:hypothetical protein